MILALGGSKRTRNPKNVMSASSALLISDADPIFLYARPRVRKPLLLSFSKCCWIWFLTTALQEIRAIARVRCLASSLLNPSLAVPRCWSISVAEMLPEGRRELVHRIAELASLLSKVQSNFCCNLAISHLVNCFDTDDASTQAFIRETLFELSLCLTGTK